MPDAFSGAKLASMGFAGVKDKKRRLELHNPDESVGLEFTGKMYVVTTSRLGDPLTLLETLYVDMIYRQELTLGMVFHF